MYCALKKSVKRIDRMLNVPTIIKKNVKLDIAR